MQAVLILAHRDFDQLNRLVKYLRPIFQVYIHIDKKFCLTDKQLDTLKKNGAQVYSVYDVKWGSYSIVQATVFLMKAALRDPNNQYFHLISGLDWPLQSPQNLYDYFENNNRIYMNYWPIKEMKKTGEPEIWWVKYYFNYDRVNRRTTFGKFYHRFLLLIQTLTRINKLKKYHVDEDEVYAGQEWVDIPRLPLEYSINKFENDPKWVKIFSTSFCSDEIWLQTMLCNSVYKDDIDKNIHRYINMTRKHGSRPAILDDDDYDFICKGNYWWGRKIVSPYSDGLLKKLNSK